MLECFCAVSRSFSSIFSPKYTMVSFRVLLPHALRADTDTAHKAAGKGGTAHSRRSYRPPPPLHPPKHHSPHSRRPKASCQNIIHPPPHTATASHPPVSRHTCARSCCSLSVGDKPSFLSHHVRADTPARKRSSARGRHFRAAHTACHSARQSEGAAHPHSVTHRDASVHDGLRTLTSSSRSS